MRPVARDLHFGQIKYVMPPARILPRNKEVDTLHDGSCVKDKPATKAEPRSRYGGETFPIRRAGAAPGLPGPFRLSRRSFRQLIRRGDTAARPNGRGNRGRTYR